MDFLIEFLPIVITSFGAGVLCGGCFFGNWFIKYEGEKIRQINHPSQMAQLRTQYAMEVTKQKFSAWQKLLQRNLKHGT